MTQQLRLRQTGGSVSVTIPRDMAKHLGVGPGEQVYAIEVTNGVLLTPYDDVLAKQLEAGAAFMKKYRAVFRKLATE